MVHETSKGECFLRVGDESRKLTYTQRQELHYDRGAAQFEGTPAKDVELKQLDVRQIQSLKDAVGFGPDAPLATILNARSLLTVRGEVTIAALLLLGAFPQALLPQAHVRVLRYREAYRGTGRHQTLDAEGDRRLEGCIPDVIRAAVHVMDDWVPKRRALGARGLFEDTPVIPRDAWLEGLVNAVVHRSYSLAGDHVRVEIFPDRIEIESPGRFPGLADPRRPLEISRYARNPRIARVCSDLRITQERGEGIRRIFDEMREVGLVDPTYEQTSGSVRLTLMAADRLDPAVARRLPMGASDVLAVLRDADRPLGTGELMELLGRSRPWVRETLEALRAEGQVQWRGKSSRDPRATWAIVSPEGGQATRNSAWQLPDVSSLEKLVVGAQVLAGEGRILPRTLLDSPLSNSLVQGLQGRIENDQLCLCAQLDGLAPRALAFVGSPRAPLDDRRRPAAQHVEGQPALQLLDPAPERLIPEVDAERFHPVVGAETNPRPLVREPPGERGLPAARQPAEDDQRRFAFHG